MNYFVRRYYFFMFCKNINASIKYKKKVETMPASNASTFI